MFLDCVLNFTTNEKFCGEAIEFSNKIIIWKTIVKVHMAKGYGEYEHLLLDLVMYIFRNQLFFSKGSQAQYLDNDNLDDDVSCLYFIFKFLLFIIIFFINYYRC